jgi:phage baseplate assembly protein W
MATFLGIAFPFAQGPQSFPAQVSDDDLIQQALIQLIGTPRGQRVMRPAYGTDAWKFVFENNNATLAAMIRTEVARSIAVNERRVVLYNVDVSQDDDGNTICTIQYIIPATSQKKSLTVPIAAG